MEAPALLEAVELFSGVGGWSHALKAAHCPVRVVRAFDSNEQANIAFKETFGLCPVATDLAMMSASKLKVPVWLASPPCQVLVCM